ncbi:MAG: CRTAC1 family protein [Planctomycetales bacterium]|nr:CRTAC1 family protein [Planctomycetales bacterium]
MIHRKSETRLCRSALLLVCASLLLMCVACRRDAELPVSTPAVTESKTKTEARDRYFDDVTDRVGIDFVHVAGGKPYFVPRSIGSGVALGDFNNDDLLDIYLIQNGGPDSEARNVMFQQRPDNTFVRCPSGFGADVAGFGMGAAAGDVNNDGKLDLAVSEFGAIRLFINVTVDSEIKFVESTSAANLANSNWGTSLAFFDYDRDGWLDLVVANYLDYDPSRICSAASGREDFCGPQSFDASFTRLFHNEGIQAGASAPRFKDVTATSGFGSKTGSGLGVLCADFNGDHWPDVFVANDGNPNTLWINQGDGTFQEKATRYGVAYNSVGEAEADMGVAFGDVNGDQRMDLFVTHRAVETHTLWASHGSEIFVDQTASSGITNSQWRGTGFGAAFGDFDNDGDLDLTFVNGRVLRAASHADDSESPVLFWDDYAQQDQLFVNDAGKFVDVSNDCGAISGDCKVSRGLACGDLNNDGRLDLVVTTIEGRAKILFGRNESESNWLSVRVMAGQLNRDAMGAVVRLTDKNGGVQVRLASPNYSFLSSNDLRVHFGLGDCDSFQKIEVTWLDGTIESFVGGKSNQFLTLTRGTGGIADDAN